MKVNNGRQVDVVAAGYSGRAGLVEHADRDVVSFPMVKGATLGDLITIEGRTRSILSTSSSPFLPNYRVIELAK